MAVKCKSGAHLVPILVTLLFTLLAVFLQRPEAFDLIGRATSAVGMHENAKYSLPIQTKPHQGALTTHTVLNGGHLGIAILLLTLGVVLQA